MTIRRVHVTPEMNACADIIEAWYQLSEENTCGGALHIVVDDNNTDAHHIVWCLMNAETSHPAEMERLAAALLTLNPIDRYVTTTYVSSPYRPKPRPPYVDVDEEYLP